MGVKNGRNTLMNNFFTVDSGFFASFVEFLWCRLSSFLWCRLSILAICFARKFNYPFNATQISFHPNLDIAPV